jgi:hypothetical protein
MKTQNTQLQEVIDALSMHNKEIQDNAAYEQALNEIGITQI